jgi:hypothetical protein
MLKIDLESDCKNFNFLHLKLSLTSEHFTAIQPCVIPIPFSKVRVTVCVHIAIIRNMNVIAISEHRSI